MSTAKKLVLLIGDVFSLYLSLILTLLIRYGVVDFEKHLVSHLLPFSLIFVVWLLIFYLSDLYRPRKLGGAYKTFGSLFVAASLSIIVSIILFYLFVGFFNLTPKTNLFVFGGLFLLTSWLWRIILIKLFTAGATEAIILGDSPLIQGTINHLADNPQTGYKIVDWLKDPKGGNAKDIIESIKTKKAQLIIIIQPHLTKETTTQLVKEFLPLEMDFVNFWDFYESIFEKVPFDELEEGWFMENITTRRPFYDAAKRGVDFFLSFSLGLIFLPLAVIIGIAVALTSRGPITLKQERRGKNSQVFTLYKFRTMSTWTGGNDGTPAWTLKDDPRITPFGKLLRFTHLDELPQLLNILIGDISFTGPRPERTELAEKYENLPYYEMRHIVKPGLTGWAQINYKPSASLEEAKEKLKYDIYYVKNRSFFLDVLIIIRTVRYIFLSH
ncbi:MAG: sugar transferase [Patescibacteria group bacterium]